MSAPGIDFSILLQEFFLKRLIKERGVSPQTVASYRDAFELLFRFVEEQTGHSCSSLNLEDIDAPLVLDFLDHLERERGNSPRTRNARLTAIRSFMRYAAVRDPTALSVAKRVLAIPGKRHDRPVLGFLSRPEMEAVLSAPDSSTWGGQRDALLLAMLYNTGARVSEITALCRADVLRDRGMSLRVEGKGRKQRVLPLWKSTASQVRAWLDQIAEAAVTPLFPNRFGERMSRSGVRNRLECAVARAQKQCPSLAGRSISPHTIRHSTAMHLLQAGVDLAVIALWLGHEDIATTHSYLEADLTMKENALKRVTDPAPKTGRFQADHRLLAFLDAL